MYPGAYVFDQSELNEGRVPSINHSSHFRDKLFVIDQ